MKANRVQIGGNILKYLLAIVTLGNCLLAQAEQKPFTPVAISYEVSLQSSRLGNATLGELQTKLQSSASGYKVVSETKAEGMAAVLMGSSLKETCDFKIQNQEVVSKDYQGGHGSKITYQVNFDWQNRKITFNDEETVDMPKGYVIDNCNLPFAFAITQGKELNKPIYIVDGKKQRVRGYTLQSSQPETITTNLGKFETIKVVMQRELKPEKTLTLWLAKENQFLPVKMEEKRSSRTTTMSLNSLEKLDAS